MAGSWWNTSYSLRRNINVVNTSTDVIPENNPIYIVLDYPNLTRLNKIRDDFADIEILFWDYESATPSWTILPRTVSYDVSTGELTIIFNTVYEIATQDTSNYFLHYTNPSLKNQEEQVEYSSALYAQVATPQNGGIMFSRPSEDWLDGVSLKTNARSAFSFFGANIAIVFNKRNDRGIVEISLDGGVFEYLDTYSNTEEEYTYMLGLSASRHYIRFRVTGDKNPSSSNSIIEIKRIEYSKYFRAELGAEEIYSLNSIITIMTGV